MIHLYIHLYIYIYKNNGPFSWWVDWTSEKRWITTAWGAVNTRLPTCFLLPMHYVPCAYYWLIHQKAFMDKIVWRRETEYSRIGHLQENYIPFLLQGLCVMSDKDNLMYLSIWFFPHEEWMRSLTWRFCPRNLGMYLLLYNSNLIYNLVYFYVHSMWH